MLVPDLVQLLSGRTTGSFRLAAARIRDMAARRERTPAGGRVNAEPPPFRELDWREALRLRRQGLNDSEIGRRLGFAGGSVRRCLERHGIPRPHHESQDPRAKKPDLRSLRSAWEKMRRRCEDPSYPPYQFHGARGVRVCREWRSFESFSAWSFDNGFKRGLWLVRIRESGPYSPGNCKWVSQAEGRRVATGGRAPRPRAWSITAYGETKSANEWGRDERCAVSTPALIYRLRQGWPPEEALETPPTRVGKSGTAQTIRAFGEEKSIAGWERDPRCQVRDVSLRERLSNGWSPEDAISLPRYSAPPRYVARRNG